jgi:DNA invertase Pin-like site-specific DNA recombinase
MLASRVPSTGSDSGGARAKAEGKYKGRKPTARARARAAGIPTLRADGVRPVEIARRLGIGREAYITSWQPENCWVRRVTFQLAEVVVTRQM